MKWWQMILIVCFMFGLVLAVYGITVKVFEHQMYGAILIAVPLAVAALIFERWKARWWQS